MAHRIAQSFEVVFAFCRVFGNEREGGGDFIAPFVEHKVTAAKSVERGMSVAVFAQYSLKIVGFDGQFVGIAGRFGLLHGGKLSVGIRAAVEHIVAHERRSRTQFGNGYALGVRRVYHHSSVRGHLHTAAHFRGEIGRKAHVHVVIAGVFQIATKIRADGGIVHRVIHKEIAAFVELGGRTVPRGVGVTARNGQLLQLDERGVSPNGSRVKRNDEARLDRQRFKRTHMRVS